MIFQSTQDWDALGKSILVDHGWVDEEMRFRARLRWSVYLHEQQRSAEAEVVLEQAIVLCPGVAQPFAIALGNVPLSWPFSMGSGKDKQGGVELEESDRVE
jgi:hypothetical protein